MKQAWTSLGMGVGMMLLWAIGAGALLGQQTASALETLLDREQALPQRLVAMRELMAKGASSPPVSFWDELRKDGTLHPALNEDLSPWMKAHPQDADLCRFTALACYDRSPTLRAAAALAIGQGSSPFLRSHRDEAMWRESHPEARKAWLQSMTTRRPTAANAAAALSWRKNTPSAEMRGLIDEALYGAACTRLSLTTVARVWPSLDDAVERGFSAVRGAGPMRSIAKTSLRISVPVHGRARHLLLGYRLSGNAKVQGRIRLGTLDFGIQEFTPGPGAFASQEHLRVLALEVPPQKLAIRELTVELAPDEGFVLSSLKIHGVVVLEEQLAAYGQRPQHFAPSNRRALLGPSKNMGAAPFEVLDEEGARFDSTGRILPGKVTRIRFKLKTAGFQDTRRLHLSHWSRDPKGATVDVSLNGRPLVRILSQNLPRPARVDFYRRGSLVHAVEGWNTLVFTRIQGTSFVLDGIHLYP
ncbi:MAG: hypothetical protein V3W41_03065 [Planctomycetota bacterium]